MKLVIEERRDYRDMLSIVAGSLPVVRNLCAARAAHLG